VSEEEPGAMKKAKGLAKESAGKATGDEEMKAEGRVEQEEGSEEKEIRVIVRKSVERSSGAA